MLRKSLCILSVGIATGLPVCGQQGSAAPVADATIRSSSDLVLIDIVVRDKKQNASHGLKQSDFTIEEDGKTQTVKVFEEHKASEPIAVNRMPRLSPGAFTNYTVVPEKGPLNILLLDKLNTPIESQSVVRDQVVKYLKDAPLGTPMAIFSLTTQLKLLQGFTSNPALLRAVAEGKKGSPGASVAMDNAMEGDQPGADNLSADMAEDSLGNSPDGSMMLANLRLFQAEQSAFQIQLRQQYTLDALNQLARLLSTLPGRKNLIWFSGSFPISILPDPDLQVTSNGKTTGDEFAVTFSADREFHQTVSLLSRSQVAVYPIDARGLMTEPMLNASQNGSTMNRRQNGFSDAESKWFQNTVNEQGTMQEMAKATGGRTFVNTNGLKEAIQEAIATGSDYYTIGYSPTNRDLNGAYRRINVKVNELGDTLAYRRGYFADDVRHENGGPESSPAVSPSKYDALRTAMQFGAPDPTELIFVASVRPAIAGTEDLPAQGNQPGKGVHGPFRRYTVTFLARATQVSCTLVPDGSHHCTLDFVSVVYTSEGKPVNLQSNQLDYAIPAAQWASAMTQNISFHQEISVPEKGAYDLRVGMRDGITDKIGAVEIPVATVAKLPVVASPDATAGSSAPKQ